MGLLNKLTKKRNSYNENVAFLKDHGIDSPINQIDFEIFMENKNLSIKTNLITENLFLEYIKQEKIKEQQKEEENRKINQARIKNKEKNIEEERKMEKRIKNENNKILKDYGIESFSDCSVFKRFMKSKNLSIKRNLITEELITEFLKTKTNFYEHNNKILKEKGMKSSDICDFKFFMESQNISFWKDRITQELIQEYLKQKRRKEEMSINEINELEYILKIEKEHHTRLQKEGRQYYFSEEAKIKGKLVYQSKKHYIKKYANFELIGANLFQTYFYTIDKLPIENRQIYRLLGEGKYNEDKKLYEKAILLYEQAITLFFKVHGSTIKEIEKTNHIITSEQIPEKRLRICKNKLFKRQIKLLEVEARELETTNPNKAIDVYNKLNRLKPGLKKYNERIKICQNKIKKV